MDENPTLSAVKLALRITTDAFNSELLSLIDASLADMGLAGVYNTDVADPLILRAVCTYCRMNFGEPSDYDRLKKSYDEQKSQLGMATGYTTWIGLM